jgi:DNA invertase Pin-like site-specific DNA recombinase
MIQHLGFQKGAYIYCRVSSKEQSKYNEGHTSLEVQEQAIRKYCETNDIKVLNVIREVYSARNMDKMRGLHYLCNIAAPGQSILVYDISRFSRNAHHALNLLEELNNNRITVFSVTENLGYNSVVSRNQFRLQLCAANYFSDICSQKVKASIAFRRDRGDHIGSTPFGFMTEVEEKTHMRSMVHCPEEKKVIERLCEMNKEHSAKYIADALIKDGVKFRNRQPTAAGIKRIIERDRNQRNIFGRTEKSKKYQSGLKMQSNHKYRLRGVRYAPY